MAAAPEEVFASIVACQVIWLGIAMRVGDEVAAATEVVAVVLATTVEDRGIWLGIALAAAAAEVMVGGLVVVAAAETAITVGRQVTLRGSALTGLEQSN